MDMQELNVLLYLIANINTCLLTEIVNINTCLLTENFFFFFEEERKGFSLYVCLAPQETEAPNGLWRSQPESQRTCPTGLPGCDLQPRIQHFSWQPYTSHGSSLLLTLGAVSR